MGRAIVNKNVYSARRMNAEEFETAANEGILKHSLSAGDTISVIAKNGKRNFIVGDDLKAILKR